MTICRNRNLNHEKTGPGSKNTLLASRTQKRNTIEMTASTPEAHADGRISNIKLVTKDKTE